MTECLSSAPSTINRLELATPTAHLDFPISRHLYFILIVGDRLVLSNLYSLDCNWVIGICFRAYMSQTVHAVIAMSRREDLYVQILSLH